MTLNFTMVFLGLLVACFIGFEAGRYLTTRKFQNAMKQIGDELRKAAQQLKERNKEE